MLNRLQTTIEILLKHGEFDTVDKLLYYIDIKHTWNCLDDLIELSELCGAHYTNLRMLGHFRKQLVNKIHEQRGDEGQKLINRVLGVK